MDTAAPVAPGVWCCQVMPVLLSAVPGDIQVEPGKPLGEVLQEKPGGDGAAAVLAGVADVGIVAADQVLVLREVRHAPEPLAGVPGGPGQAAVPAVVGGHDAGGHIAQHGVHGSREGGDIHQVGAALPADGPGEAVSQDQAALGIGVEDLHGLAGKEGDPVPGEHAGGGDAVFTGGDHRRDVDPDSVPGQSVQGGGSRRAPGPCRP